VTGRLDGLQDLADRVVAAVGPRAEAQVVATRTRHGLTRFANSAVHQHVGEDTTSVLLTVAVDGRVSQSSTSAVGPEPLAAFVEATLAMAQHAPVDTRWPGLGPVATGPVGDRAAEDALAGDPDRRVDEVEAFVRAAPELRAAGYLDTSGIWAAFANSAGQRLAGRASRATLDGIHQTATSAGSAHVTSRALADVDGATAGATAADVARRSERFADVEPGDYEVVLGPEAAATVAQFIGLYGFDARAWLDGQSFVRPGEAQLDPAVTLVDDPTHPASLGLPFDAEGTPRTRTVLVDAGVSAGLLHDRRTAREAGTVSTGNAVPGGAGTGAVPADLVLAGGALPPEELLAGVGRGLFVRSFHYCRVLDPRSLEVTGLTRNGTFLVEHGRVVGAVGTLRFTQSFAAAVAPGRVLGVGDDVRFASGELGSVLVQAPSLRLASWHFSGGARG
jgi:predicted Zn-dependent protease